jgi:hypothetical protein
MRLWWNLTPAQKARRVAGTLWFTPLIMLLPLWIGLPFGPDALAEHWPLYLLFFGLPLLASIPFYILARRLEGTPPDRG